MRSSVGRLTFSLCTLLIPKAKYKETPMFSSSKSQQKCSQKPKYGPRRHLAIETLQRRELMASDVLVSVQPPIDVSAEEQLMIELVNRARAAPGAEAARYGIDLNAGLSGNNLISPNAKQPLAPVSVLQVAASRHSTDMLMRDYFAHDAKTPAPNGTTPTDRAKSAGYKTGVGENLSLWPLNGSSQEADVLGSHKSLFESPGHRSNILAEFYTDIGVGIEVGDYTGDLYQGRTFPTMMTTEKFGLGSQSPKAITGVVFADTTEDNDFYNLGEGVYGLSITAVKSTGERYSTTTGSSGGYTLQVPSGTYQVFATDGRMEERFVGLAEVSNANVKLDLMTDKPNTTYQLDTNQDGMISPLDALMVINYLNRDPGEIRIAIYPSHLDVNQNGLIESIDALIVINELNRGADDHIDENFAAAGAEMESNGESIEQSKGTWYDPTLFFSESIRKEKRS